MANLGTHQSREEECVEGSASSFATTLVTVCRFGEERQPDIITSINFAIRPSSCNRCRLKWVSLDSASSSECVVWVMQVWKGHKPHPINEPNSFQALYNDLKTLDLWSKLWLVNFILKKTSYVIFSKKLLKSNYPDLYLGSVKLIKQWKHK